MKRTSNTVFQTAAISLLILTTITIPSSLTADTGSLDPLPSRVSWDVEDRSYECSAPSTFSSSLKTTTNTSAIAVSTSEGALTPEPVYVEPAPEITYQGGNSFQSQGVIIFGGFRCTYYNPSDLGISAYQLGLNTVGSPITDRGDGIGVVNGYVAVAMPVSYVYGSIVDTPFGAGMVVDHSQGAIDVVVFW